MQRRIAVVLALLAAGVVGGALAAGVLATPAGLPPGAQAELDQYLRYQRTTLGRAWTVRTAVHATNPTDLTPELSGATYSDSAIYGTTYHYGAPTVGLAYLPELTPATPDLPAGGGGGSHPLPYPPVDAWCVVLDAGAATDVVVVALHQDMYSADWVLHEMPENPTASLAAVGCDSR